jgi:hypothetical protein
VIPEPPTDTSSIFLVERYLPVTDLDELAAAVTRVGSACADSDAAVRYLHSTFVPAEDTCFCVFQAPSAQSVRAVNEAARFGLDRIVSAVGLDAGVTGHERPTPSSAVDTANPSWKEPELEGTRVGRKRVRDE